MTLQQWVDTGNIKMNTLRKMIIVASILSVGMINYSCSVSFRHSNRTASNVSGTGFVNDPVVEAPIFDPAGGTVKWGTNISIHSQTSGSSTYYNVGDGTQAAPDPSIDLLYDESNKPIMLNSNVIKARSFKVGYIPSDVVSYTYAVIPQIFVGGEFPSSYGNIALLNMDGTLDNDFASGSGTDGSVRATAIQDDGKILVAGDFTHYNGVVRNRIARLNVDGTLDTSFDPGQGTTGSSIYSIAIQRNGKILIAASVWTYNGTSYYKVIRLDSNGIPDPTFITATNVSSIYAIAIQDDDKILIGGSNIVRLNIDGSVDSTFNPGVGPNSGIGAIAVQKTDGKILVGGDFNKYNNIAHGYIVRLNSDGSFDNSFNVGGVGAFQAYQSPSAVRAILLTEDGKIFISGTFCFYNGIPRESIAKLNSDGSLDETFVPEINDPYPDNYFNWIVSISIQKDGKILIGGQFAIVNNGVEWLVLGRLNSDGSYDDSFSSNTIASNMIEDELNAVVFSAIILGN